MRVSRVDVNPSMNAGGDPIFVVAARGALVLPTRRGVEHRPARRRAAARSRRSIANVTVPLIRRGKLDSNPATHATDAAQATCSASPTRSTWCGRPGGNTRHYGILQTTGTQKALFRQPRFQQGVDATARRGARFRRRVPPRELEGHLPQRPGRGVRSRSVRSRRGSSPKATSWSIRANPAKVFKQPLRARAAQADQRVVPEDLRGVRLRQERHEWHAGPARHAAVRVRLGGGGGAAVAVEGRRHRDGGRSRLASSAW